MEIGLNNNTSGIGHHLNMDATNVETQNRDLAGVLVYLIGCSFLKCIPLSSIAIIYGCAIPLQVVMVQPHYQHPS